MICNMWSDYCDDPAKMFQYRKILVILFSMLSNALSTEETNSECSVIYEIQHSVHLTCPGEKSSRDYWTFNKTSIFSSNNLLNDVVADVAVDDNYTLIISNVSWDHFGTYECIRNGTLMTTHHLCVTGLLKTFFFLWTIRNTRYQNSTT